MRSVTIISAANRNGTSKWLNSLHCQNFLSCTIISVCRAAVLHQQFYPAHAQLHPSGFTPRMRSFTTTVLPANSQFQYSSFTRAYCSVLKRSNGYCYQLFLLISLQSQFHPALAQFHLNSYPRVHAQFQYIVFVTNYFCLLVIFCCCSQAFVFLIKVLVSGTHYTVLLHFSSQK